MLALLRTFSWQDLRHHPWRSAAAVAAVMLGVALAFAVHVINASALDEFSQAVRAVNGQPDLEAARHAGKRWTKRCLPVATHPAGGARQPGAGAVHLPATPRPDRHPRLRGAAWWGPMRCCCRPWPRPSCPAVGRRDAAGLLAPATVFLNPAALQALGVASAGQWPALRCSCKPAWHAGRARGGTVAPPARRWR
jgi:putative ABC transport system permease protein